MTRVAGDCTRSIGNDESRLALGSSCHGRRKKTRRAPPGAEFAVILFQLDDSEEWSCPILALTRPLDRFDLGNYGPSPKRLFAPIHHGTLASFDSSRDWYTSNLGNATRRDAEGQIEVCS